jgi:hypothetical protein
MKRYTYTNQADVRDAFWNVFFVEGKPRKYWGKSQNDLPADIRVAFCDFVDMLEKDGQISEALAQRVTL